MSVGCSGRSPAVGSKKSKSDDMDDEEDLTKDMADPVPEPNISEVPVPKPSKPATVCYCIELQVVQICKVQYF